MGVDSTEMKKRMRVKHGGRALLLRRTLLCRPDYAAHVKELRFPEYDLSMMTARELKEVRAITASVVACCKNLEKLVGYYQHYKAETGDDMQSVLISRKSLREHIWIITSNGQMKMQQSEAFINVHAGWTKLETLVLQGKAGPGSGSLNSSTFTGVFQRLPVLKKLLISRFHDYEFDNSTLVTIPVQVECLRLEDLPGVTDTGISEFIDKISSHGRLRGLSLLNLEIRSLATISKLLSNLSNLEKFTLLQTNSPQVPLADRNRRNKPHLSSRSLKFLHWDLLIPGPANMILAHSIRANEFPSLRTLRAPSDHHGILQAVCMPLEKILLPFDEVEACLITAKQEQQQNQYYSGDRYSRSLPEVRISAQERIETSRESPFMRIIVTEAGLENRLLGVEIKAFMGDLKSKVTYSLLPDLEGAEEAVADVPGFVEARIRTEWKWTSGCSGKWNKGWARTHPERVRARSDLTLDLLF